MIRTLILAAHTALATLATAHEFWVQPETLQPTPGRAFRVTLMHGERFDGDPVPRVETAIDRFELIDHDAKATAVRGLSGSTISYAKSRAGQGEDASATLVYQTHWIENTLPAKEFNAYLEEEGLDDIARQRRSAGETHEPGRERYMRCAKALLDPPQPGVGRPPSRPAADRPVHLPLEIIIESRDAGGVTASVRLNGEPLRRTTVVLAPEASPAELRTAQTDDRGLVVFDDARAGRSMLTVLHMERAPASADADWQSYWASSVFAVTP